MPHLLNLFELHSLLLVNNLPIVLSVMKETLISEFFNSFVINFPSLLAYWNLAHLSFGFSFFSGPFCFLLELINPLTPKDHYSGRTAPLTSKCCILYIYPTNIGTEYFKHDILYSPFFSLLNAVCFIILNYLVPVLFTFYIQSVLKLKK